MVVRLATVFGTSALASVLVFTAMPGVPTVRANVLVKARLPVVATCVNGMTEPHGTVLASRYWNGVVLVAVPPAGTFGYEELGWRSVLPGSVGKMVPVTLVAVAVPEL